jgi:hypothetical protein
MPSNRSTARSRMANIGAVYNFENARNGGKGPGFFLDKFVNRTIRTNQINQILEKKYDLSIFILSDEISIEAINTFKDKNELKIQKFSSTTVMSNINAIKQNIKNDKNRKILLVDETISQNFTDTKIPFFVIDKNKSNLENLSNFINLMLFYKLKKNN